jgi:flagellar motility protein MotE (MotC chaperone)
MSEEFKDQPTETQVDASNPAVDEIKNLKAEMNRKLSNFEQTNAMLLAQLQALSQPKPSQTQAKPLADLWLDNPDEAAAILENRIEKKLEDKYSRRENAQARQQQTIAQLVSDFPELSDTNHAFTKRAVEIYNSMPDDERSSPVAYKAAVKEAALDMGLKPKSKRSQDDTDNFSLGGSGMANRPAKKNNTLDPNVETVARLFGIDVSKADVRERLKSNHGRKSYGRWE